VRLSVPRSSWTNKRHPRTHPCQTSSMLASRGLVSHAIDLIPQCHNTPLVRDWDPMQAKAAMQKHPLVATGACTSPPSATTCHLTRELGSRAWRRQFWKQCSSLRNRPLGLLFNLLRAITTQLATTSQLHRLWPRRSSSPPLGLLHSALCTVQPDVLY
jgi:hypothetical protein